MNYWIAAFIAAVAIVIARAAGPMAVVISPIIFFVALYLLWAYEIGYKAVWTRFGLDRLTPPVWNRDNQKRFLPIFEDRLKVAKAGAVVLGLIALSLLLTPTIARVIAVLLVLWYLVEIYRAQQISDEADRARYN